jgi:phosphoglucosamine mutase
LRTHPPKTSSRHPHRLSAVPLPHAPDSPSPAAPPHPQTLLQLAHALGTQLVEQHDASTPNPAVFVGCSAGERTDMVVAALQAGFNAAGVDVVLGGTLPTPAVAFVTRARSFQAGVAVAGSCKPFTEHGLRLFNAQGACFTGAEEAALAQRMRQASAHPHPQRLGHSWPLPSAAMLYAEHSQQRVEASLDLQGLSVVLDTANGGMHAVAPGLLERLGARVYLNEARSENRENTGDAGGAWCEHLSQAVRIRHADIGIALSADGQRVLMADAAGRIYGGDELLYLLACDARQRGALSGGVVGTTTSNLGLELALGRQGVELARAAPGERQLLHTLRQRGWTLGGCPSGLLLNLAVHHGSDGLLGALQVLSVLQHTRRELADLCSDLHLYAQCQINLAVRSDSDWQHNTRLQGCRQRAELELGGQGRVLLHACEHEPLLRVMVECPDARRAAAVAMELAHNLGHAERPSSAVSITV